MRLPAALLADRREAVVRSGQQSRSGRMPDDIHMFNVIATQADPSLAPDGQDTLYLYVPITPVDPEPSWDVMETKGADAIVGSGGIFWADQGRIRASE